MKKFVVLTMILAMASLATAGLTIVGAPAEAINPSDTVLLSISATDAGNPSYYALGVSNLTGSITGGALTAAAGNLSMQMPDIYFGMLMDPTGNGVMGAIGNDDDGAPPISGIIIDVILFHCEGLDDAVVTLYSSADTSVWTVEDSVTIAQIPEPMTMALLGLGGLFLRRKK